MRHTRKGIAGSNPALSARRRSVHSSLSDLQRLGVDDARAGGARWGVGVEADGFGADLVAFVLGDQDAAATARRRAREIDVVCADRHGDRIAIRAHGHPARVIQHETDHLDGVLFFDRMKSLESMTFLDEYARYWRKTAADD